VRAEIEERCTELKMDGLIMTGRVMQSVPILPNGKLSALYQSLRGAERWYMAREAPKKTEFHHVGLVWRGNAELVLGLVGVQMGGRERIFTDAWDKKAMDVDPMKFAEKWAEVMSMSSQFLQLLTVNNGWFQDRVEGLYKDDFAALKVG